MKLILVVVILSSLVFGFKPASAQEDPDSQAAWNAIVALDSGPKAAIASREDARAISLEFLAKQEAALRGFVKDYPKDAHLLDAQLRLAHLLATRSDLVGTPASYEAGLRLLDEALKTAPTERRADIAFAHLALAMHRVTIPTELQRSGITTEMFWFQTRYPNDRRVAPLMVEVASLFDTQPKRKATLLKQALQSARTDDIRARIADDLKRLELLGNPVTIRGTTAEGTAVDLAQLQGKVVLVYFFAGWSAPSIAGLDEVDYLKKTFPDDQLAVIGVSLDRTPEALDAMIKPRGTTWPVICDGKGWRSPLVRSLGINALPTLWIVDRRGCLRTLNAKTESEALVRTLLKEK
ncbi:MAG: TlpA disulfide reductase family protein [Verrucomicrobiota bacterium]